jgi:outer membrane protein assembly factor BamA
MSGPRLAVALALLVVAGGAACGGSAASGKVERVAAAPVVATPPGRAIRWRGGTYRLVAIEIEGNEHAPAADLLAMMLLAHARDIDEDVLWRDEQWLLAYYFDRGFVMVSVEPIVLTRAEFGDELRAHVTIREGPRVRVRRLDVYEQREGGARAPLSVAWTKPALEGEPFARASFVEAIDALRRRYRDRGQAFVEANVVDVIDVASRTMTLDVAVVPGRYFAFGQILITGNRADAAASLAEELAICEGDLYSESALLLALEHLRTLPWLSRAVVSTHEGRREGTVDVHFEVDLRAGLAPRMARR